VTPAEEEDHNLVVTIRKDEHVIKGIACKLWLPKRVTDPLVMRLYPRGTWRQTLEGIRHPFAIEGKIVGMGRGHVTHIRADEVWAPRASTRHHGKRRFETVVEAEPIDLQILERRPRGKRRPPRITTHTNYLLTSCPPLAPSGMQSSSYTGEVKIEHVQEAEFTLASGAHLTFSDHYRFEDRDDGMLMWPELVATHEHKVARRKFGQVDEKTLEELDDFLALVGFAARYRTVCVGISATNEEGEHFRFFRKNVTAPTDQEWDSNHSVIDLADIAEFLSVAYQRFIGSGPDPLLRHALHVVTPRMEKTGEGEFTSLYAALETIVLWYRKTKGLELIVEDENDWRTLQDEIRVFLKEHRVLEGKEPARKERRAMMLRKVGELRRVPFAVALNKFCEEYGVKLDDLWPVVDDKRGEISLTDIRNRIVHGTPVTPREFHALIGAKQHMRWVVERALLAVLGWPLERSKVRPDFLARNLTAMIELAQDRADMRGKSVADEVTAASG
jgi:hypothetical protein